MNRPLVALFAGVISLIVAPASADGVDRDSPAPLLPGDYPTRFGDPGYNEQWDAARKSAIAKWNKMTPEEQAAAKKAARARKMEEVHRLEMEGKLAGQKKKEQPFPAERQQ